MVADDQYWRVCLDEQVGRAPDARGVATARRRNRTQPLGSSVDLGEHRIERQSQKDEASRRRERRPHRSADHRRNRTHVENLLAVLAELAGHLEEVARENRLLVAEVRAVVARRHQQGGASYLRGV